jgi:4'-phosphopantetheinyl transferase
VRFFTSEEQSYISASPDANIAFYEIWTKKEAYIKYIGKGLAVPLNSFSVFSINTPMFTHMLRQYIFSVCGKSFGVNSLITSLTEPELEEILLGRNFFDNQPHRDTIALA